MFLQGLVIYLPLLFILIGISFLAGTIFYMRNVNSPLSWSRVNWRVVLLLALFFSAGYLLHSHLLLVNGASKILVIVSVVLLIASITLFISVRQNKKYAGLLRLSDLEKENQEIRNMHQRLEIILDNAAESILTFNNRLKITGLNRAGERLFGYAENELMGHELSLLISNFPEDFRAKISSMMGEEVEFIGKNHEGDRFPISLKISAVDIDGQLVYIAIIANISDRKEIIERLQHLADRDGLTGLYNRRVFLRKVSEALDLVKRGGVSCALLFIDLDNFKAINDVYGHAGGDRFLVDVSHLLQRDRRKSDYVARLGGDEFAVLVYNADENMVLEIGEKIREEFEGYVFHCENNKVNAACSVGAYLLKEQVATADEALAQADLACYIAKQNGRNNVHLFKEQDEKYSSQRRDVGWLQKLQKALDGDGDGFVLTRQPIIAVQAEDELAFYEARVCLKDAGGLIAPSVFLPIAERFDLAVAIDEWVINKVIANIVVQRQQGESFRYFIRLSQQTLFHAPIYDLIRTKINEFHLDPALLIFEVREAVAMADLRATEKLFRRLQELGCKTALDDFGAGMSAFTYLKTMPVDYVKIEGRFARNLAKEKSDQVIMQAIQNIIAVYGKNTVCKFVETKNCLELIKEIGIDYAQGYFVGRPKLDETK